MQNECASLQKDFISRVLQFSKGENEALEAMKSESVPMQVIEDMDSSNVSLKYFNLFSRTKFDIKARCQDTICEIVNLTGCSVEFVSGYG